jgi:hypothetical protein
MLGDTCMLKFNTSKYRPRLYVCMYIKHAIHFVLRVPQPIRMHTAKIEYVRIFRYIYIIMRLLEL